MTIDPKREAAVGPSAETALRLLPRHGITVPDDTAVRHYLWHHAEMTAVLERAARLASSKLGEHAALSLEVYRDPEIDDHFLVLWVRRNPEEPNLRALIDEISQGLEPELADASGWLVVMPDHRDDSIAWADSILEVVAPDKS